jgi:hypothetical protein
MDNPSFQIPAQTPLNQTPESGTEPLETTMSQTAYVEALSQPDNVVVPFERPSTRQMNEWQEDGLVQAAMRRQVRGEFTPELGNLTRVEALELAGKITEARAQFSDDDGELYREAA